MLNHYLGDRRGLFWRRYEGHWSDAGTVESLLHASLVASQAARTMDTSQPPPVADRRGPRRWRSRGSSSTGGAGFIGSAFVRRRLATTTDEIVVLDKLTYAGDRDNLGEVDGGPSSVRRALRSCTATSPTRQIVEPLVAEADAVVNFAAESHVDRSILDAEAFLRTGVIGVHVLLEAVRTAAEADGAGAGAWCRSRPTRSTARSSTGRVARTTALAPRSPTPRPRRPASCSCTPTTRPTASTS